MVVAPGMFLISGKKLKEACADRAVPARFLPAQSVWLARRKQLQLLSSFLYYFSLSYLDRPSTGAEVGRFVRFVFLFLALVCKVFCFLLANLKVMFPFSTDSVTLCLNVS